MVSIIRQQPLSLIGLALGTLITAPNQALASDWASLGERR